MRSSRFVFVLLAVFLIAELGIMTALPAQTPEVMLRSPARTRPDLGQKTREAIPPPVRAYVTSNFAFGDVMAGVSNGTYDRYDNAGNYIESLSDGMGGFTTGCATNPALTLFYTTNFSSSMVVVYDVLAPHTIVQTIDTGSHGGGSAESIVFDANGDFYVGHADGNRDVQKYDAAGTYIRSFDVPTEDRGSDWIDLSIDQRTLFYTSEGRRILRYDVQSDVPLSDFAVLPGSGVAYAHRLLPPFNGTGGLIVADTYDIKRLDGSGNVVQTYDAGDDGWFSMNLDPDGTSFWAGSYETDNFYKFDIASGVVLTGPINTGSGGTLWGLCVIGEIIGGQIELSPKISTNCVNTEHFVKATVRGLDGVPIPGAEVTFEVVSGPNAGTSGTCSVNADCTTDANGEATFTYLGDGGLGTDRIKASFVAQGGGVPFDVAENTWIVDGSCNQPPVAICQDVEVYADENCQADASIDDGSYDPDGDPITLTQTPPGPYPLGATTVTLTVVDDKGLSDTCTGTVTVIDVTPPEITVMLNRDVLWPPNHKMVDISATVTVTDNCENSCAAPTFMLISITSNEPDNGKGDGNTVGDIQSADPGTPDVAFQLRSERSGGGDGRVYTITYTATDCSGNTARDVVYVRVPHDHAGWAFASIGFDPRGSAFDPEFDRFVVIIPSKSAQYNLDGSGNQVLVSEAFDATTLDVARIYLGNTTGVIAPLRGLKLDNDEDGLVDLALFYSTAEARALGPGLFVPEDMEKLEAWDGYVGLHYTGADGVDYLVQNILAMGPSVPLNLPTDAKRDRDDQNVVSQRERNDQLTGQERATALLPSYPNPFNPSTTIPFTLVNQERVVLRIYDAGGELVRTLVDEVVPAGRHDVVWNGRDNAGNQTATGVYFIQIRAGAYEATKKTVMLK